MAERDPRLAEPATTEQAAELLRVTPKSILTWVRQGAPVVRKGRQGRGGTPTVVIPGRLIEWLEARDNAQRLRWRMASGSNSAAAKRDWCEGLLRLPGRVAPRLVGISDERVIAEILTQELHGLLLDSGSDA